MGVEMPALVDATESIATWRRVLPKGSDPVDLYVMISMDHSSANRPRPAVPAGPRPAVPRPDLPSLHL